MKQLIIGVERANKLTKSHLKKLYTTPIEKAYDTLLTKAKKGALTTEERVQARITEGV